MKYNEIMEIRRKLASEDCAYDWDNPGLLAGRSDREVREVYIALDATDKVVKAAMASRADMLLTHRPLIFKTIEKINSQDLITRRLAKLIQADISYYAMYTSLNTAPGCMADLTAKRLGLSDCIPLETLDEMDGPEGVVPYGIGKSGILEEEVIVRELAVHVKDMLGLPFTLVYEDELIDRKVSRISAYPGAGRNEIGGVLAWGAQALVTGGISHHWGIGAAVRDMIIIDGGHYELERIFIPYMAKFLRRNLGSRVELERVPPQ